MFRPHHFLALVAALAAPLVTDTARASLSACGNIDIQANAQCTAEVGEQCKLQCTPVNFEAACHGKLEASCAGSCNVTPPQCDVSCSGTCSGKCQADANFTCEGDCKTTCEGTCAGKCNSNANETDCMGACKATCSSECTTKCSGMASADCSGKCQASCQGSCSAEAHMDCQIDCQSKGFVDCQSKLTGGCEGQCDEPNGALFCDSQFVDNNGNFEACKTAIEGFIKSHVQVSASGTSNCANGTCEAQGQASCKCSRIAPTDATNAQAFTVAGLAAAAILARRRSRRS